MSLDAIQYAKSVQAPADERLPPSERHLLLLLATYLNEGQGVAWPSVGRLAKESGYCVRRVQQVIRSVQRKGLLAIRCRTGDGTKQATNLYAFPGLQAWLDGRKRISPTPEVRFTPRVKLIAPAPLKPASPYRDLEVDKKEKERNPLPRVLRSALGGGKRFPYASDEECDQRRALLERQRKALMATRPPTHQGAREQDQQQQRLGERVRPLRAAQGVVGV